VGDYHKGEGLIALAQSVVFFRLELNMLNIQSAVESNVAPRPLTAKPGTRSPLQVLAFQLITHTLVSPML